MRAALIAAVVMLVAGCATLTAPSTITSDSDRCGRYGGSWADGACRSGGP